VNALIVEDMNQPLSEDILNQVEHEDMLEAYRLSLNAMTGTDQGETIRLMALLKNQVMLVLVDSGSSHSFISARLLQKLGIAAIPTTPHLVTVANGETRVSDSFVPDLE
jgi:hypothetical protein